MPIPQSFIRAGYLVPGRPVPLGQAKSKYRRVMIGTEGLSESGKTEFMLSAPGPGIVVAIDRGGEACLDNPTPPKARHSDFVFDVIPVPLANTQTQTIYVEYWKTFRTRYYLALDNPDALTVGLDGDSDSWELQRLAEFGKLTQIPSIKYADVNASRRAMIARAYDSGKNVIATNKVKAKYVDEIDPATGQPVKGNDGKTKRIKSDEYERQGFDDTDYLWQIQLRHLRKSSKVNSLTPAERLKLVRGGTQVEGKLIVEWGIEVLKCKVNSRLQGEQLWGDKCCFAGLIALCYPQTNPSEWGL